MGRLKKLQSTAHTFFMCHGELFCNKIASTGKQKFTECWLVVEDQLHFSHGANGQLFLTGNIIIVSLIES